MLIIQDYKDDISYRGYNVEAWDSPVVIFWQCIECRKILYECKSGNVYRGLKALINKLFPSKILIHSYCESCLEVIGTDLFYVPTDMDKIRQDLVTDRNNFDRSLNMELDEFKDSVLAFSSKKHTEVIKRKIQNILTGSKISREKFIAQLDVSYMKKTPLKRLNTFYDKIDRYWKCLREDHDYQAALDECRQKISKLANMIAEKYVDKEYKDNFWDGECRQKYKEYERNWARWYKTLKPCALIVLYKYISLQVTGVEYQDKFPLNGAEIRVIEHTLPVGSEWLKRMDELSATCATLTKLLQ